MQPVWSNQVAKKYQFLSEDGKREFSKLCGKTATARFRKDKEKKLFPGDEIGIVAFKDFRTGEIILTDIVVLPD